MTIRHCGKNNGGTTRKRNGTDCIGLCAGGGRKGGGVVPNIPHRKTGPTPKPPTV